MSDEENNIMADEEQLAILQRGVKEWNLWKEQHPDIRPDLSKVNIRYTDLYEANLSGANLSGADLIGTYLVDANLYDVSLNEADLRSVFFQDADLSGAELWMADLSGADLRGANLSGANLSGADLRDANLSGANLRDAIVDMTTFGEIDLREVKGLETVQHRGPSHLSINTIFRSEGQIPEVFLRGIGIPKTFAKYIRSYAIQSIQYYTCFISYSSKDEMFAKRLYNDLQNEGVSCWFASEDLKIGDHYHQRIDESIRLYDKLILILSEHAIQSAWVEREVVAAREKEDHLGHEVLFPVRLDEAVMQTTNAWAADVRRRWHIGDFTQWKEHDAYQQVFQCLLSDLKAEKKPKD